MNALTSFFFALEKKPREQKSFHQLKIPGDCVITDQQEIQYFALFYEDLYCSELCDDTETDELLCDLSKLTEEESNELDWPLTFGEISQAVQEMCSWKSPGLDGLTA